MINLVTSFSIHTSTSVNDAMQLPASWLTEMLKSKAFEQKGKAKESEYKILEAIIKRLDVLIKKPI